MEFQVVYSQDANVQKKKNKHKTKQSYKYFINSTSFKVITKLKQEAGK